MIYDEVVSECVKSKWLGSLIMNMCYENVVSLLGRPKSLFLMHERYVNMWLLDLVCKRFLVLYMWLICDLEYSSEGPLCGIF